MAVYNHIWSVWTIYGGDQCHRALIACRELLELAAPWGTPHPDHPPRHRRPEPPVPRTGACPRAVADRPALRLERYGPVRRWSSLPSREPVRADGLLPVRAVRDPAAAEPVAAGAAARRCDRVEDVARRPAASRARPRASRSRTVALLAWRGALTGAACRSRPASRSGCRRLRKRGCTSMARPNRQLAAWPGRRRGRAGRAHAALLERCCAAAAEPIPRRPASWAHCARHLPARARPRRGAEAAASHEASAAGRAAPLSRSCAAGMSDVPC